MNNDTKSIAGVTSRAYHTIMWILVTAGLLGNLVVLVWRCSRKEARHSLLSVLIIGLAFADLLFSCHFLLQEVMLVNTVFATHHANLSIHVTATDERLCLSILFFLYVSANAITLTAVAIALSTFFSFHLHQHGNRMITGFLLISWMCCLATGGLAVWDYKPTYQATAKHALDVNAFSLFVVYECTSSDLGAVWNPFLIVVTTLNAIASVVVVVIYIYLWCMLGKHRVSFNRSTSQEITRFRIRLAIISGLNLLCWWSVCVIYWFAAVNRKTVINGTLPPVVAEPVFVLMAATNVANPIIYTIASKHFLTVARRACACLFCRGRNEERLLLPVLHIQPATHGEADGHGRASFCCRLCPCQRTREEEVLICHPESLTEKTEESNLFSESD